MAYLIDKGFPLDKAVTFTGNHYLLSSRQRMALIRSAATRAELKERMAKCLLPSSLNGQTVLVDGLNIIITLETFLSQGTLFRGMDGCIRDLCGLHGTYRLIDKTELAVALLVLHLKAAVVKEAIIYLDKPVSNSGQLKKALSDCCKDLALPAEVLLDPNPDARLWNENSVITSDAIILNRCQSWYNLVSALIPQKPATGLVDLCCWEGNGSVVH